MTSIALCHIYYLYYRDMIFSTDPHLLNLSNALKFKCLETPSFTIVGILTSESPTSAFCLARLIWQRT